jgi:enterochelin esterase-like enzyme
MRILIILFCTLSFLSAQSFETVVQELEQTPVEQRKKLIEQYLNTKRFSPIIEQDSILHFVLYGMADSVSVNGNLQFWNEPVSLKKIPCGPFSFFYRTFIVPPDARLDYQLIVNGKYITDPQNPRITPSGFGPHSEVQMPKFIPTPYIFHRQEIQHGSIDSLAPLMNIPSPLSRYIPARRSIKIYRPAGYDTLSGLPVLYVHDGFEAIDYAYVLAILDNLIADGKIEPVIAVFIPPVDRGGEYVGSRKDQFVTYLADEIVPLIDHLYRTARIPEKRAMTGISAGGQISLYTVLKRPDIFLNVGSQSSSLPSSLRLLAEQQSRSNRLPAQLKLYLDCGRYDIRSEEIDFLAEHRSFSDLLSSLRIPHYYKEVNDGHEWASWRERMPEMFIYFFGRPL